MTHGSHASAEISVRTPLMTVELRHYRWREPFERRYHSDAEAMINFSVPPRETLARGRLAWDQHGRWRPLGQIFMVPPNVTFDCSQPRGSQHDHRVLTCLLARELFERAGAPEVWSPRALESCLNLSGRQVVATLRRILEEVQDPGFASSAVLESLGLLVAVDLLRMVTVRERGCTPKGGLSGWRWRLLRERLQDGGQPPPAISELAVLVQLSPRQLTRGFREDMGQSLGRYIRNAAIDRAKALLAKDRSSIKQIAGELGFASATGFSQAFRTATGLQPTFYRQIRSAQLRRPAGCSQDLNPTLSREDER